MINDALYNKLLRDIEALTRRVANLEKQSVRSEIAGLSEETEGVTVESSAPTYEEGQVYLLSNDGLGGRLYFSVDSATKHDQQLYIGTLPASANEGSLAMRVDEFANGILYIYAGGTWSVFGIANLAIAFDDANAQLTTASAETIMTGSTNAPATDPGWATSDSVPMTAPATYLKFLHNGQKYSVPVWASLT